MNILHELRTSFDLHFGTFYSFLISMCHISFIECNAEIKKKTEKRKTKKNKGEKKTNSIGLILIEIQKTCKLLTKRITTANILEYNTLLPQIVLLHIVKYHIYKTLILITYVCKYVYMSFVSDEKINLSFQPISQCRMCFLSFFFLASVFRRKDLSTTDSSITKIFQDVQRIVIIMLVEATVTISFECIRRLQNRKRWCTMKHKRILKCYMQFFTFSFRGGKSCA